MEYSDLVDTIIEVQSIQPMTSLLEQSLLLFTDIVVMLLMERNKIDQHN
jgi:D-arabinose 5-phosphate isomerase GutQ